MFELKEGESLNCETIISALRTMFGKFMTVNFEVYGEQWFRIRRCGHEPFYHRDFIPACFCPLPGRTGVVLTSKHYRMKVKFTIKALKKKNAYRVVVNGTRSIELKSSTMRDLLIFMISQALANSIEYDFDVYSRGGGTFYLEYIPGTYDNTTD